MAMAGLSRGEAVEQAAYPGKALAGMQSPSPRSVRARTPAVLGKNDRSAPQRDMKESMGLARLLTKG
jgi:hypothetical protein